jgi:hypothetical protein
MAPSPGVVGRGRAQPRGDITPHRHREAILDFGARSLEQRKFVRRQRNKADRRKTNVFLTPAGRALKATLLPCAVTMTAQARQGLSPEKVITFLRLLETMIENLLPPERHRKRRGTLDSLEL